MAVIRAVLFDYGLVLSGPPDPAAWEQMRAVLEVDEASFYAAYWRPRPAYDRGALDGRSYWRAVAEELERSLREDEFALLLEYDVELWTQPNQPMIDWVAALKSAAFVTGVCSNMGDAMEDGILRRCPWMSSFDHHTFSHRLKMVKPEAAIYQHVIRELGLPAEEILFIDDRKENVEAAEAAGMQAIQYLDHAGFVDELRDENFDGLPLPAAGAE
ncbi:MAG TPA: HAD family phosphatase [Acidobacteriaceae bacterium]|jgi:putative hydrolase of the HAD superfamily|nr:HAD family phosphatase [Acidobacteriaceae bacterium]